MIQGKDNLLDFKSLDEIQKFAAAAHQLLVTRITFAGVPSPDGMSGSGYYSGYDSGPYVPPVMPMGGNFMPMSGGMTIGTAPNPTQINDGAGGTDTINGTGP